MRVLIVATALAIAVDVPARPPRRGGCSKASSCSSASMQSYQGYTLAPQQFQPVPVQRPAPVVTHIAEGPFTIGDKPVTITLKPVETTTEVKVKEKRNKTIIKTRSKTASLDRLNAWRAQRGLFPYVLDEGLQRAAEKCAAIKAQGCISGHIPGPMSDFACLEPGVQCSATGADGSKIHASDPGWYSCCASDTQYRYAGAAVEIGPDNNQYFSLFVR